MTSEIADSPICQKECFCAQTPSIVAGKRLYHPVKCAADAKLGALARGMAQGHNSMETMSTPARQDMLVGALEGFLEDLPSS